MYKKMLKNTHDWLFPVVSWRIEHQVSSRLRPPIFILDAFNVWDDKVLLSASDDIGVVS